MTVFVGTSGWQYQDWRGPFYPRRLPQAGWLSYFAARFQVVEVNNTFYRLPKSETFASWSEATPEDFIFALKMNRYLTHIKRLRDPQEPVERFFEAASRLGGKIGPLLLQLPPNLSADTSRLRDALQTLPSGVRAAVEFRHESWYSDEIQHLLTERKAALCLADRGSRLITPLWVTADWGYIRLHEGAASPRTCYGERALQQWAERIAEHWDAEADLYVFFNNDAYGCAVHDACQLAASLAQLGLKPSRVPTGEEVHLG